MDDRVFSFKGEISVPIKAELCIVDQHVQLGADGKSNKFSVDAGIMINSSLVYDTNTTISKMRVHASDAGVTPENIQDHLSVFTQQTSKMGMIAKTGSLEKNRNDAIAEAKNNATLNSLVCAMGAFMLNSGLWILVENEGKGRSLGLLATSVGAVMCGSALKAGRWGAERIVHNSNTRAETIASARTLFALAAESGSSFKVSSTRYVDKVSE